MPAFSLDVLRLNAILGLPPLERKPACMKYQHGCRCRHCVHREKNAGRKPKQPKQPWDIAA